MLGPNYAQEDDRDTTTKKKTKKKSADAASEEEGEEEGEGEEEQNGDSDGGATPTGATVDAGRAADTGSATVDAGAAATVGANVFATGPAFASSPPARQAHQGNGPAIQNNSNCMNCHGPGGNGPPFVIGGTVTRGGQAVADAEVRVIAPNGTITKTNSDTRGYFWIAGAGGLPAGARVGARTAAQAVSMKAAPNSGGCNGVGSCHSGTQGLIDLASP